MDLRNDPRTLSMMEVVPPPKPREFSEAEKWYCSQIANANPAVLNQLYASGMRACTDEELAEAQRKGYIGLSMTPSDPFEMHIKGRLFSSLLGGL